MDTYAGRDKSPLEKLQAENNLASDALRDPALFVQLAHEHFDNMDKNGSGGLSRIELYDSEQHSKSPVEREISRVLLQNYDKAVNLASQNRPAEIGAFGKSGGTMGAWDMAFKDTSKPTNEITDSDIQVIDNLMVRKNLAETVKNARSLEIQLGVTEGVCVPVVGLLTALAADLVPPAAYPIGAFTAGLAAAATNNLLHSNKAAMDREIDTRFANVHSWNYFKDNGAEALMKR